MARIRIFTLLGLFGLAACAEQAPAPVSFGHRGASQSPTAAISHTAPAGVPQAAPQGAVTAVPLDGPATRSAPIQMQAAAAPQGGGEYVTVQAGDTVYALARRHTRPVRAIIDDNNLQPPYVLTTGQRIRLPTGRFHTVQTGETLYSISRNHGTDVYAMAQANGLPPPYTISVGQSLRLPAQTGYAVTSAAAPAPDSPTSPQIAAPRGFQAEALPPPSSSSAPPPVPQVPAPLPEVNVPAHGSAVPQAETEQPAPVPAPQVAAAPTPPPVADPQQDTVLPPRSGRTFSWPVRGRVLAGFGPTPDGLHNDGINIAARAGAPVIAAENGVVVYAGSELKGFGNLLLVRHADGWITAYAHLDKALVKKGQKVTKGQAIGTVGTTGGVSQPQLHFEIRRGTQAVDPAKFLSVA